MTIRSVYWAGVHVNELGATARSQSVFQPSYRNYVRSLSDEDFKKCLGRPWLGSGTIHPLVPGIKDEKNVNDSWIFILAREQLAQFEKWIEQHSLQDYVMFKMERPITNRNHHISENRQLTLAVLQSPNHFQRKDVV